MSDEFERDPEFDDVPSKSGPSRGLAVIMRLADLVEIVVKVVKVLGVIVILIVLLMPCPPWTGKVGAARCAQCVNNLKQIALALNNYEQEYNALPPAYTVDAAGKPLHSWRTLILPYLDQEELYRSIDLTKPWDDPANARALAAELSVYRCPAWLRTASGWPPLNGTTYRAIVAPGGCFDPTRPRRLEEITDGTRSTLMVIEVGEEDAVPWMAPVDANEAMVLSLGSAPNPPHAKGRNACFVDGVARGLNADTPAEFLRALISIAGGEDVPQFW